MSKHANLQDTGQGGPSAPHEFVFEDLPAGIPISPTELDAIERLLGIALDQLFQ